MSGMKCNDCDGELDFQHEPIMIRIRCEAFESVYPCKECGRLHDIGGGAISARSGEKAYLIDERVAHI